jgi:adenine-specific DNA-methyltransferase
MLLGRCEFGKNDYSLNIVNVPVEYEQETSADIDSGAERKDKNTVSSEKNKKKKTDTSDPTLF